MKTWLGKIRLWEVSLLILVGFVSFFFWTTAQSEKELVSQIQAVLTHTDKTLTNLDTTLTSLTTASGQLSSSLSSVSGAVQSSSSMLNQVLAKVMAPCTPEKGHIYTVDEDKPCGTLADFARTLHTIRGFAGTLEFAGRHLDKSLNTYDKQEADLTKNTNSMLANVNSTVDFAHQLMVSHQQILDNLQRLAGNSADTMQNVTGITGDIRVQTKALNAPKTKTQKVLQWMPPLVRTAITVACATMGPC